MFGSQFLDIKGNGKENRSTLPETLQAGQTIKIHLFFDHSIMDLFINDRRASSIRIFSTSTSAIGASVFAEEATTLNGLEADVMKDANWERPITAIDNIPSPSGETRGEASKHLRNGHLRILHDGKLYDTLGRIIQ